MRVRVKWIGECGLEEKTFLRRLAAGGCLSTILGQQKMFSSLSRLIAKARVRLNICSVFMKLYIS